MTREDLLGRLAAAFSSEAGKPMTPEGLEKAKRAVADVCQALARDKEPPPTSMFVQFDTRTGRAIGNIPVPPWWIIMEGYIVARRQALDQLRKTRPGARTPADSGNAPEDT